MTDSRRKLVVLAAGVGSRSGDALRLFAGFRQFLIDEAGFAPDDFLEATYAGRYAGGRWVGPAPYDETASTAPLAASIAHCAQALLWWARQRPRGVEWHLVGFSLGGLVLLEAAGLLHERAPDSWGQYLRSLTTLSSPLNGCALGEFSWLGAVLGPGAVGAELCALGNDPRHRARIAALVARLRAAGVVVTTLVEADDAVVQPADGIVGPIDPALIVPCQSQPDDPPGARYLGHGRIVNEPRVWQRLLALIGPQVGFAGRPAGAGRARVTPPPAEDAQLARELQELKRRLLRSPPDEASEGPAAR